LSAFFVFDCRAIRRPSIIHFQRVVVRARICRETHDLEAVRLDNADEEAKRFQSIHC
jgi:hypothetical protein